MCVCVCLRVCVFVRVCVRAQYSDFFFFFLTKKRLAGKCVRA